MRTYQVARLMIECPVCKQRQREEQKQLERCEQRCKHSEVKNQRLSIVLAVVATLVAKETLDKALEITDTVEQAIGQSDSGKNNGVQDKLASADLRPFPKQSWPSLSQDPLLHQEALFPQLPPLLIGLGFDPWKPMISIPEPVGSMIPEPTGLALLYLGLKPSRRRHK